MSLSAYMLCSSSKGNSAYIKNNKDEFLIDAGASLKQLSLALSMLDTDFSNIKAVFITHEHSDHIRGLHCLCKRYSVPIYAPPECCAFLSKNDEYIARCLVPNKAGSRVTLNNTEVFAVKTPHDALASVGYRIDAGGERLAYFTDIGCLTEAVLEALSGCERVLLESNHDLDMLKYGSYPQSLKSRILGNKGHLSNTDCARILPLLVKYGSNSFTLAHLSRDNNTPEKAYRESYVSLKNSGYTPNCNDGMVSLRVAAYDEITEIK